MIIEMEQAISLNQEGEDLYAQGHMQDALFAFTKALEIDPSFTTAHNNLGVLYWQVGETQKAVDHFIKAINLDPNNRNTILNYGNILTDMGKIEDARNLYSPYIQNNPEDDEILSALRKLGGGNKNSSSSPLKAYDKLWEEKCQDSEWLRNDQKTSIKRDKNPNGQPVVRREAIRFLQVHTFYQAYLDIFYKSNPHLCSASFDKQMRGIIADGFSGIHIFSPYMGYLNYDSGLIVANNEYAQLQWAKENDVKLTKEGKNNLFLILNSQISQFKPDVLYLTDPITFDSRFISSLNWKPSIVMGWRAANIPQQIDWSRFDVMLSSLSNLRNAARDLGARATEHFYPGYPDWMNAELQTVSPQYDVVFSGTWSKNQHRLRNEYIKAIAADATAGRNQYSCAFYLNGQNELIPAQVERFNYGPRFGRSMYKALRSGRIVIDARATHEITDHNGKRIVDLAGNETANMRMFEVTGCGSFLLTEYYENLSEFFKLGVEIETFRNREELIDKIHYYLANPEKREEIAKNGQQRCLDQYTMKKRAVELDRIIKKYLPPKASSNSKTARMYKEKAQQLYEEKEYKKAFDTIIRAKNLKQAVRGLDFLRALCFLKMNSPGNTYEAIREEIRLFPDNQEAIELFKQISTQFQPSVPDSIKDKDFLEVLEKIRPYTMLSVERLHSLYVLTKMICEENLPGYFVECGVAAGGSTALLAYVIKKYSRIQRRLYSFDSFEGMPEPTKEDSICGVSADSTGWGTGTCAAPEENVKEICEKIGVSDVVTTVKGYFQETLPKKRNDIGPVVFLHMDGDWYESTKAILINLYEQVVESGLIQIDDYGHWEGCRKAIDEFQRDNNLQFNIHPIDGTGVWFQKQKKDLTQEGKGA